MTPASPDDAATPPPPAALASAPASVVHGRQAWSDALRDLFLALPQVPTGAGRDLWMVGEWFEAWPLDEPAVLDALSQWIKPAGRRLHIAGGDFEAVQRRHPRFATWRRDRGHLIDAWQPAQTERVVLGPLLLAPHQALELLEVERWSARSVRDPSALRALRDGVAALLHRCESGWPVTTLGL